MDYRRARSCSLISIPTPKDRRRKYEMRKPENIREWKTRKLISEMERADAAFWAWQANGPKPGYDVEKYSEDLAEELKNRGLDY